MIAVFSIVLMISSLSTASVNSRTFLQITRDGVEYVSRQENSPTADNNCIALRNPSSGVLWSYSVASGLTGKTTAIGNGASQVFAGTYYGGAKMFTGTGGSGTPVWETTQPAVGTNQYWRYWSSGAAASVNSDIFFCLSSWEVWDDMKTPGSTADDTLISENIQIDKFSHSSATPLWTFDTLNHFIQGSIDDPGKYDLTDDGSMLAIAGTIGGHLAVMFFSDTSPVPVMIYENPSVAYSPRQIRLTSDGSKCIFSCGAVLYRIDVLTGALEATHNLGASTDCFGVSGDGSIVSYGFTSAYIAQWNGVSYSVIHSFPVSGYYAGASAISENGNYVYFGFYKNTYLSNRIYCYDVSLSSLVMTYDYPTGSGSNQDVVSWMECSGDGMRLIVGSWGCQTGGGDEIEVFDISNPTAPVFSINTPGSVFDVTITPDGHYISGTGKHVHANTMGSGIDLYFAEVDLLSVEEQPRLPNNPIVSDPTLIRLHDGSVRFSFRLASPTEVTIDLYGVNGGKISNVVNSRLEAGEHSFVLDQDISHGVYFLKLSAEEFSVSEKFFVLE
ncbi:hypothetical protein JXA84_08770 [candidate division WOR-3 bacterium]|nr:hypothetical protein [candidate division WOR-3 bacterium]